MFRVTCSLSIQNPVFLVLFVWPQIHGQVFGIFGFLRRPALVNGSLLQLRLPNNDSTLHYYNL